MNNKINTIIKRDGRKVNFDENKIENAINKAFLNNNIDNKNIVHKITKDVVEKLKKEEVSEQTVEHVQDIVEETISENGYFEIAKDYILYREKRTFERNKKGHIFQDISKIVKVTDRENANVGNGPSSKLLQIAEVADKEYIETFIIRENVLNAISKNLIHIHDASWYGIGTTTCTFIPLRRLLKNGFNTGHGFIRPPKRIRTASQLACIIFQSNQNDQHGGQAYGWFDRDMAPYVKKEFEWQIKNIKKGFDFFNITNIDNEKLEQLAWERTKKETYQAMEGLVFNLNSMHSRAGAQVPFTSINIGTDTTKEGRLISKMLLLAYEEGLGKKEQPLFPNIIFKIKKNINFEKGTPNYDLFLLSLKVTSKRLFPNYVFQDCSLNKDFPEDVPVMGCRTRVSWNKNKPIDQQTCEGRGNGSFTTANLPGIALKAKYNNENFKNVNSQFYDLSYKYKIELPVKYKDNNIVKKFFIELNDVIEIIIIQLLDRMTYQSQFKKEDFPFLMSEVWMDASKIKKGDFVTEVIKNATLGIGFIGLAETLKCLVGKHHGEDLNANALGYEIVKFIRTKADRASDEYNLNFALLATPAEGLSEKFVKKDKKIYGIIHGVTDKDWYTNSFHVPVEYTISVFKKIEIEGKYHHLCNGGQISYIELKEAPIDNIEGILRILKFMSDNDMGYVAINFPVDRCRNCNLSGIITEERCPVCNSPDISRIRRITGYLAELDNFNHGKLEEALHRVSHN